MSMTEREVRFRAFVDARYPAMVRTGFLLTGDRGHAEDLVQSALIRAYVAWGRIGEPDDANAYVRKVMVRLAARARRRPARTEIVTDDLPEAGQDPTDARIDALALRADLLTLPAKQRAVLVLRYYEGLSEAETADVLGCSLGTVKSRASRGLAALRQLAGTHSDSHKERQLP